MPETMIYGHIMNFEAFYGYKNDQSWKKNIIASRIFLLKGFEFQKLSLKNKFNLIVPVVMMESFEVIADDEGISFSLIVFS